MREAFEGEYVEGMVAMHPQLVQDASNRSTAALLPWEEWQALLEELEELEAIRAYDKAVAEPQEFMAFEDALKELGEAP